MEPFKQPNSITITLTDPKTGEEFKCESAPPEEIETLKLSYKMSPKELVLSFMWLVKSRAWLKEEYPGIDAEVDRILPIVDYLVAEIQVYCDGYKDDGKPILQFRIAGRVGVNSSIYKNPVTKEDIQLTEFSEEFIASTLQALYETEVLLIAMSFYVYINRDELNRRFADGNCEGSQNEPIVDGRAAILPLPEQGRHTQIGLHLLSQFFGESQSAYTAEEIKKAWEEKTGVVIENPVPFIGVRLTDIQHRVMDGILSALTHTNYKGNLPAIAKSELVEKFDKVDKESDLPNFYKYVQEIPKLKIGRRELVRLAGMNDESQTHMERTVQALGYLATTQFCFYYTRLAKDANGKPERDAKTGDWKKEHVYAVDSLFKIQIVNDDNQNFKHYEITPAAIFLDQQSSYYLLVPFGWREEVKAKIGEKKISSYLFLFIIYLQYQFEQKRRKNSRVGAKQKEKYEIKCNWQTIAKEIKMPESVWRGKKARAITLIDNAYWAAKELGYLISYKREGEVDKLVLNPAKYPAHKTEADLFSGVDLV
ncbi:hypothetical protein GCM10027592_63180 [Spirosoma flavus]